MTPRRSADEWAKLMKLYDERDCSKDEFCRTHEVSNAALSYQLNKRSPKPVFTPTVRVADQNSTEVIVEFPGGIRLSVRA